MADQQKAPPVRQRLRTIEELNEAHEWLFEQSRSGALDNKTADVLNTTLKGSVYLNGRLKLDYAKLIMQAQIKKVTIPRGLLPELPS